MANGPAGKQVICPECGADAIAIVPKKSEVVEEAAGADGKVLVNCRNCGERFPVHFRVD